MNDHVVDAEPTTNVLVWPETITAFIAWDAVNAFVANDDVPANWDVELETYELNADSSNLPVPTVTPFNINEPVILTEPVNVWVSSNVSPNLVEPDVYIIEELT